MRFDKKLELIRDVVRNGENAYLPGIPVPHINSRVNEALRKAQPGDLWCAIGTAKTGVYRIVKGSPDLLERLRRAGFYDMHEFNKQPRGMLLNIVDHYLSTSFLNPPKMRRDSSRDPDPEL